MIGKVEIITGIALCVSAGIFIASTLPWWEYDTFNIEITIAFYLMVEFGWKLYYEKHQTILGMVIDFMSFAPTLGEVFVTGGQNGRQISQRFVILRMFRLARLAKLVLGVWPECELALDAMHLAALHSLPLLSALLLLLLVALLLGGSLMYACELPGWNGRHSLLDSIPMAAWSVVEMLTTVGLGDVAPITPLGRLLGGFLMLSAMALVAFPSIVLATNFQKVYDRLERERKHQESDPLLLNKADITI